MSEKMMQVRVNHSEPTFLVHNKSEWLTMLEMLDLIGIGGDPDELRMKGELVWEIASTPAAKDDPEIVCCLRLAENLVLSLCPADQDSDAEYEFVEVL